MTVLVGRSAAFFGAGRWDPEWLGSAIARQIIVRSALRVREVDGEHNDMPGTSAGDAISAVVVVVRFGAGEYRFSNAIRVRDTGAWLLLCSPRTK